MAVLRDADELLWPAVEQSLAKLELGDQDSGAAKLAQLYAQVIDKLPDEAPRGFPDRRWGARWIAPLLLDCLEQLGATPAARARVKGGKQADAPVSQLAKLRAARRP
ncbi:MAG: terminase small subunit [Streptosporangiaceae bacterium]